MLKKRERKVPIGNRSDQPEYPRITFQQALDFAMNAKRAEGLRSRSLNDYGKHFGYLMNWLSENYSELEFVNELTSTIVRDYINYQRYDARRYNGHKHIDPNKQRIGLTDTTCLRTLKAIFNQLRKDRLIEINPLENVSLLKQDIDLTNCLTDDEVKAILAQPNQKDYVGYRDYVAIITMLDSGLRIQELLGLRT